MRRGIELYLNVHLYRKFSAICKTLGIRICDVLENFMRDFIEKHRDQIPLDYYLEAEKDAKSKITDPNFTRNNYNVILAKIARFDPEWWLEELKTIDVEKLSNEEVKFWKEKLPELFIQAIRILEEAKLTGYTEQIEPLQEFVQRASEILQRLLKKNRRKTHVSQK